MLQSGNNFLRIEYISNGEKLNFCIPKGFIMQKNIDEVNQKFSMMSSSAILGRKHINMCTDDEKIQKSLKTSNFAVIN